MTCALTPELALRYLAELEPAIEAAAVATADGAHVAGDGALAAGVPARDAAGVAAGVAARFGESRGVVVARSSRHTVIARVRPGALRGLVRHDLEAVARDLDVGVE